MLDAITQLIGEAPAGYEWMQYTVAAVVLLLVCKIVVDVFFSIFKGLMKW